MAGQRRTRARRPARRQQSGPAHALGRAPVCRGLRTFLDCVPRCAVVRWLSVRWLVVRRLLGVVAHASGKVDTASGCSCPFV